MHLTRPKNVGKFKGIFLSNSAEDLDESLQGFCYITFDDDVDVDEFMQKLAEIRVKISLLDKNSKPSDSSTETNFEPFYKIL